MSFQQSEPAWVSWLRGEQSEDVDRASPLLSVKVEQNFLFCVVLGHRRPTTPLIAIEMKVEADAWLTGGGAIAFTLYYAVATVLNQARLQMQTCN